MFLALRRLSEGWGSCTHSSFLKRKFVVAMEGNPAATFFHSKEAMSVVEEGDPFLEEENV